MNLSEQVKDIGRIAAEVVAENGGVVTFDEYDKKMLPRIYFAPINWIAGWGLLPYQRKANTDKQAAFVACHIGLIRQTKTGYELTDYGYTLKNDGMLQRSSGSVAEWEAAQ